MKLITHNFLSSQFLKGVTTGYPLILRATKIEKKEVEYNEDFTKNIIPKLDYSALVKAVKSIDDNVDLPEELVPDWEQNEEFLQKIHSLLVGTEVIEGELECPESGRCFKIREGIPNMLANADELEPTA